MINLSLTLIMLVFMGILPSTSVLADNGEKAGQQSSEKRETRPTPALSQKFYKRLSQVQKLLDEENFTEAVSTLEKLQQRKLNSYEAAMTYNMLGFSLFQLNRIGDSVNAYKKLLEQPNIPLALETRTLYMLAQIQFSEAAYQESIGLMKRWLNLVEQPSADGYALIGQSYYQLEKHEDCLEYMGKAVALTESKGRRVNENWLLVQQSSLLELERHKDRTKVLETLVTLYPKTPYLLNLAGAYGQLEQISNQLSTLELVYRRGELTKGNQLLHLSQLLFYEQVPYKAAEVLDQAMTEEKVERNEKNLQRLATYYRAAKEFEKSLPKLEAASKLSKNGKIDVQLANSYYHLGHWHKAIASVDRAIKKGGDIRSGSALLLKGQAGLQVKEFDLAINAFSAAVEAMDPEGKRHKEKTTMATQWLAYAKKAKQRHLALAD